MRSLSYREFTRLVYGRMGNTRIPLPAFAYSAIRKQFPINKDENYVGFELDDDQPGSGYFNNVVSDA